MNNTNKTNRHLILVNNTGTDLRNFDEVFIDAVRTGKGLPEELADLFTLEIIEVDGKPRGILNFA